MAYHFKPCVSRTACTENGTHCRACGRSHEEINELRNLMNGVTAFAARMEYDNCEEFLDYLKNKVLKKLKSAQAMS
jgi:hypothetical protein